MTGVKNLAQYSCFQNKAIAIVGGAVGIGKSCAKLFANQGADVFLADIDEQKSNQLCDEIKSQGLTINYLKTDATNQDEMRAFAEFVGNKELYAVINCTGGFKGYSPTIDIPNEEWDRVIKLNLYSTFYSCKELASKMIPFRRGAIVNVSSISARTALENTPIHYSCSKAAVESMTRVLASELGSLGIRVNAVAPGTTKTERAIGVRGEKVMDLWGENIPRGTLATPEEIANVILFLASEDAAHITGVSLDVNGGQLIV
jgi:NAD(P)-dependent dehydrogenase (short-subunit alcohol dehydrogenase family)